MKQDRRTFLKTAGISGAAVAFGAGAANAAGCPLGPPPHAEGPHVWMNMDQVELDAAYDQSFYAPTLRQIIKRYASSSEEVRTRLGAPKRVSYGPTAVEMLDIFTTKKPNAPTFVFIHGGAWRGGEAKNYAFPAEMFVNAGAHYIALDFINVIAAKGDIAAMADQVRRAIVWVHKNASSFGGNADRLYIGGHSSGGHLCGVALTTDWQKEYGAPADIVKGGLCMSGMYDLKPVRLSARSHYVKFTDAMETAMSSQRHIANLRVPIICSYGTNETPEFQRQNRDFAAAVKAAGKPVELIEAANYNHFEMCESLGNPYGPNGRAALKMMNLA
ncbi:MAG TPA: alpha/beta hydrolase [Pseudolabrys sp.]|jgi:arylformamidase|nr:alpha/beta hydrolase [Pseudolabrys sp.]